MNAREFIAFASSLSGTTPGSAPQFRSAVSRAYYGAFHYAKNALWDHLKDPCKHGGSEHKYVQILFLNCDVPEGQELGRFMENLSQSRKDADYALDRTDPESQKNAALCVARAEKIVACIDKCFSGDLKSKIVAGITGFKKKTGRA